MSARNDAQVPNNDIPIPPNAVAAAAAAGRARNLNEQVAAVQGVQAAHADLVNFLEHDNTFAVVTGFLEQAGIKREYGSYVLFGLVAFYLIFGSAARLACNLIGFGYPMYASVKAVRTTGTADDTTWLIYWTCFAVLCLLDFFSDAILSFFPFYYIAKALFLIYLYLPQTRGAVNFYASVVDPLVVFIDANLAKFDLI